MIHLYNLVQSLSALPDGIANYLWTQLDVTPVGIPSSKDGAKIASGKAMVSLHNALIVPFGGLTVIDLLLRTGQHNTFLQGMVTAGIEVDNAGGGDALDLTTAFRLALLSLPQEILDKLQTPIPTFEELDMPTTVEEAIIATGTVNAICTQVLAAFNGIFPVLLLLKSGQYNSALGAGMTSMYEFNPPPKLIPIQPTDGAIFYGWLDEFRASAPDADAVTISFVNNSGQDELENLEPTDDDPDVWAVILPVAIGEYTATFTGTWGEEEETVNVAFEVRHWETSPTEGETVPTTLDQIKVLTGEATGELEAVSATIHIADMDTILTQFVMGGAEWIADTVGEFLDAPLGNVAEMIVTAEYATGEIVEWTVNFVFGEGE